MQPSVREFLDTIMKRLFEAEDRRLDAAIAHLNRKNSEIKGKRLWGFRHQGVRYIPSEARSIAQARAKEPLPTLAFTLMEEGEAFILDAKRIDTDRTMIRQLFVRMLDPCMTTQEVRDALPACVVPLIPELARMEQRFQIAWSITTDARTMRLYEKLLPKIEMYSVSHLLY